MGEYAIMSKTSESCSVATSRQWRRNWWPSLRDRNRCAIQNMSGLLGCEQRCAQKLRQLVTPAAFYEQFRRRGLRTAIPCVGLVHCSQAHSRATSLPPSRIQQRRASPSSRIWVGRVAWCAGPGITQAGHPPKAHYDPSSESAVSTRARMGVLPSWERMRLASVRC